MSTTVVINPVGVILAAHAYFQGKYTQKGDSHGVVWQSNKDAAMRQHGIVLGHVSVTPMAFIRDILLSLDFYCWDKMPEKKAS